MWKLITSVILINLLLTTVNTEYTITRSNEVDSYHYPAPPKSQQLYEPARSPQTVYAAPQAYQNQYQSFYHTPARPQHSSMAIKQFFSPALDHKAFNLALGRHGYMYGNERAPVNAAFRVNSRSSKAVSPSSSLAPVLGSLNVKLPLPFGVTPLNIAPLPLQTGTPYAAIPNAVTSYGTIYPQRRRR